MSFTRKTGEEQPAIPILGGFFKVRVPLVHYRWSWPDAVQGAILACTGLAAVPVLKTIGVSTEVAILMVFMSSCLYLLHSSLGDAVVPGWITSGVPLVIAYLATYAPGLPKIHALIALQLTVAFLFFFLGITGLGRRLVLWLPSCIKAGILVGAGIAAIMGEFKVGGRFNTYPISATCALASSFFMLYGLKSIVLKERSAIYRRVATFGIAPGIFVAAVVGAITGEIKWGAIHFGLSFNLGVMKELYTNYSPFSIGFPSLSYWVGGAALAVVLYVVGFNDMVLGREIIREGDETRPDEKVEVNLNRTHVIVGIRNAVLALFAPYAPMHGPIWAGAQVATVERYKIGRNSMDSLVDGASTFYLAATICLACAFFVDALRPLLGVGLTLTMVLQGWACIYVGVKMLKTVPEMGIMGLISAVLIQRGAAWGLCVGLFLYFLLLTGGKKQTQQELVRPEKALAPSGIK